jgi:hypothetical protein
VLVSICLRGASAAILAALWEGIRVLNGAHWSWQAIGWRFLLAIVALGISVWVAPRRRRWMVAFGLALLVFLLAVSWDLRVAYDDFVAWLATTALFVTLLLLESAFFAASQARYGLAARLEYGASIVVLAVAGGVTLAVLAQVESRFSDEEFFVALEVFLISVFSLLLLLAQIATRRLDPHEGAGDVALRPLWGIFSIGLIGIGFAWWSASAYQASFYSPLAPAFTGVSADDPFLCATLAPAPGAPDGHTVFQRIQALVESNPRKGVPEFGWLALITGEERWAQAFRVGILAEAQANLFTEPSNSVKYGQRLAARRAFFFSKIREQFPNLFSEDELLRLDEWFAAVNRRAMTVEWVDLLYGLAFSTWPQGPYENQENGAGLLALLESGGLSDEDLSAANRDYLAHNLRGWVARFRNSDDAYLYQTEWIDNALFQELYAGKGAHPADFERHRRLAFEWLLMQMLPGGASPTYNHPGAVPLASVLYLAALLLDDPRYVWAAEQSLASVESGGRHLSAQPGLQHPADLEGTSPTQGTCLLYSPSGLPTQAGPLAPDKIVFRDGWMADATYLLLNLRFAGWHRYKATNSIVLLYQDEPVIVEDSSGQPSGWLPIGRSLFRDKRIPRENLNGLLIPRSGLGQVVYSFSGLNGPWAQDPPHYADVKDFHQLGSVDASRTTIDDWRGWQHERSIYFLHQGPVLVIDSAHNPSGGVSALTWHLRGIGEHTDEGLWLRRVDPAIRVALPTNSWRTTTLTEGSVDNSGEDWELTHMARDEGQLNLITAFLMNGWGDAEFQSQPVDVDGRLGGQYVRIDRGSETIRLLHNGLSRTQAGESATITASGMSTDGLGLLVFENGSGFPQSVCAMGGSQVSLAAPVEPGALLARDTHMRLRRGTDWQWDGTTLTLWPSSTGSICVDVDH